MISSQNIIYLTSTMFQFDEKRYLQEQERIEIFHHFYDFTVKNIEKRGGKIESIHELLINSYWEVDESNLENMIENVLLFAAELMHFWIGPLKIRSAGLFFVGELTGAVRFNNIGTNNLLVHSGKAISYCHEQVRNLENYKKGTFLIGERICKYIDQYDIIKGGIIEAEIISDNKLKFLKFL